MTKKINLGIIGVGYWGSLLVKKFSSLSQVKVLSVADLQKNRLAEIKQQFPHIKTTTKYEELLTSSSIKAIVVATPVSFHYKIARDCLLAGKHVFVEKPLVQTSKQAKELCSLAKRKKLVLMTDYIYLYHPAVQKMKQLIEKGKLGRLLFIQSVRLGLELFPKGVDVIWDLIPHDVALTTYFLNKKPKKITCQINSLVNQDTADTAFINFSFSKNLATQIMISWLSPTKVRHFVIGGTKGTLVFDETREDKLVFFDTKIDKFGFHKIFQPSKKAKKVTFPNKEPLISACLDFVNSITRKKEPLAGKDISLKTVEILEKIK
ncbi:hypothetical protein AMJ51_01915 [Microgenomates bacterium DG_75]|nr:MAG: hypothetical protein AMJ51_01915 [Microgenomates bacterium DG_75]